MYDSISNTSMNATQSQLPPAAYASRNEQEGGRAGGRIVWSAGPMVPCVYKANPFPHVPYLYGFQGRSAYKILMTSIYTVPFHIDMTRNTAK